MRSTASDTPHFRCGGQLSALGSVVNVLQGQGQPLTRRRVGDGCSVTTRLELALTAAGWVGRLELALTELGVGIVGTGADRAVWVGRLTETGTVGKLELTLTECRKVGTDTDRVSESWNWHRQSVGKWELALTECRKVGTGTDICLGRKVGTGADRAVCRKVGTDTNRVSESWKWC